MLVVALLVAAAAPPFVVGDLKVFRDWAIGCDNGRDCHATSLPIEEGPEEPLGDGDLIITIKRSGHPYSPVSVSIGGEGALRFRDIRAASSKRRAIRRISVDNRKLAIRLKPAPNGDELDAASSAKLIAAMRGKNTFSLLDHGGQPMAVASIRGLDQVLAYLDERQYLTGTVAALARPSKKPVNARNVPPMVPRHRILVAGKPDTPPSMTDDLQLARLREGDPCLEYSKDVIPGAPSYYRLDSAKTLMILPPVCGGYNPYRMLFIVDEKGTAQPARFWPYPGNAMEVAPDLPDVGWNEKTRMLESFGRGRVLADCGQTQAYVWYEGRFKLVHDARMAPCRGRTDYITTYYIEVVTVGRSKPGIKH